MAEVQPACSSYPYASRNISKGTWRYPSSLGFLQASSWESSPLWESDSRKASCIRPYMVNSAWVCQCLAPILIRAKVPGRSETSSGRAITCWTGISNLSDALSKFHRNWLQFEGYRVSWGNSGWSSLISPTSLRIILYSSPAPYLL